MSLVDRCDEITRLIDDALRGFPPADGHRPVREEEPADATRAVRRTDGRWSQRPTVPAHADVCDAAA